MSPDEKLSPRAKFFFAPGDNYLSPSAKCCRATIFVSVDDTLEAFFNAMHYIKLRFTYLLFTYLLSGNLAKAILSED